MKSQVLVNQKTQEIICIAVRKGKVHDFRMWKESHIDLAKETEILADKQGKRILTGTQNMLQLNSTKF